MTGTLGDHRPHWSRFDSGLVPAVHRTSLWSQRTAAYLLPMAMRTDGEPILGEIAGCRVGLVRFAHLRASAHAGVRAGAGVDAPGAGYYKVALALRGRVSVRQYDRSVCLEPGQVAVYDTSDDYEVGSELSFGVLIAMIPHDALDPVSTRLTALSASMLPAAETEAIRRGLLRVLQDDRQLERGIDDVMTAVEAIRPREPHRGSDHDRLLDEARRLVHSHLRDPRLGPDFLAARLGVSRRLLYQVFADGVGPVAAYVRSARLDLARTLLADPDNDGLPIGEIAADCGFADAAHFSRLFRQEFRMSPREYRTGRAAPGR